MIYKHKAQGKVTNVWKGGVGEFVVTLCAQRPALTTTALLTLSASVAHGHWSNLLAFSRLKVLFKLALPVLGPSF